jgi:hypothetical protein
MSFTSVILDTVPEYVKTTFTDLNLSQLTWSRQACMNCAIIVLIIVYLWYEVQAALITAKIAPIKPYLHLLSSMNARPSQNLADELTNICAIDQNDPELIALNQRAANLEKETAAIIRLLRCIVGEVGANAPKPLNVVTRNVRPPSKQELEAIAALTSKFYKKLDM